METIWSVGYKKELLVKMFIERWKFDKKVEKTVKI